MLSLATIGFFSLASIILALTPGPDMLFIATRSMAQGRSAGIVSALGVHTGVLVHTLAAALGLSALIAASAAALSIIKYAGAAYLIYLGLKTMAGRAETLALNSADFSRLRQIYFQGLITNLLNPKVILFFLAFLPQFVDPSVGHISLQLIFLGVLMVMVTLPIDLGVGLAGGTVGKWLNNRVQVQHTSKWFTGALFIALGIGTAFTGTKKT